MLVAMRSLPETRCKVGWPPTPPPPPDGGGGGADTATEGDAASGAPGVTPLFAIAAVNIELSALDGAVAADPPPLVSPYLIVSCWPTASVTPWTWIIQSPGRPA